MKSTQYIKILAAVFALSLYSLSIPVQAADKQAARSAAIRDKLVFQVSDDNTGKWRTALSNAKNVQEELGADKVIIEIVVYGAGLGMLTFDSPVGSEVAEAISAGVKFVACENTMKGKHLTRDDMLPSLSYARAAVVELMRKQQQGYAYIKL